MVTLTMSHASRGRGCNKRDGGKHSVIVENVHRTTAGAAEPPGAHPGVHRQHMNQILFTKEIRPRFFHR